MPDQTNSGGANGHEAADANKQGSDQRGLRFAASILETIGNTPLVRLNKLTRGLKRDGREPLVLAKVESFNPGGSVKDRIGRHIVERAEQSGALKPGGTIVEATSGNTGLGLAMSAAVKGYRCVCVMPDKMSQEKRDLLKAYGARVVICPTNVPPDSPESNYETAKRIARETPGGFLANQYFNPHNPETHYLTTGPELWEQTGGRITHFVASMGTGGTISGTGRYLKEMNPSVQVIGADPVGSILAEYFRTKTMAEAKSYLVEGIGEDIIPGSTHFEYIDDVITIGDRESFRYTRRLSREEGILCGGSAGTAVAAALQVASRADRDAVIVVILPDTGERYLSKAHNDTWLRDNGMLEPEDLRVSDFLYKKVSEIPTLLTLGRDEPLRRALALVREHNVSQIPVMDSQGNCVGTVLESTLMSSLIDGRARLEDPIWGMMEAALPLVGAEEPLSNAVGFLSAGTSAVLVEDRGADEGNRLVGILSRFDLIEFVAK